MREKKHYNKGHEIAVTFPVPKEQREQQKINKQLQAELEIAKKQNATQKRQNDKQAELIEQLEDILKKLKKDK